MLRSLSTVGGFTLMSRVLGLAREMLIAAFLTTTYVTDAFYIALRLPNMFRRIFGEGAFNSAFVPMFGRDLAEGRVEEAHQFARTAFAWLGGVLVVATLIIIPGMPWFAKLLAPMAEAETFELVVAYGRIMFSYLLCMALAAHLSGVLNTLNVFSTPAFAPVLLNVLMLIVLAIVVPLAHLQGDLPAIGTWLSWSVCLAGFAQLGLLWIVTWRKGVRIFPVKPRVSPKMRRLFVLMVPGVIAAGIQQINLIIGTAIASSEESAVSSITFAERLFQMPNGMIGAAFGVVLLPEVTRLLRSGNQEGANESVGRGIFFSMLLTLPAAFAFLAAPAAFVGPLYQRVKFTADDTLMVAPVLAAFAIGLPAYVLIKVLQAGYFARENTLSPMKLALITALVGAVASVVLFRYLGPVGIGLSTSIAGWVNVVMLAQGLRGSMGLTRRRLGQLLRVVLSSSVMGATVWFGSQLMADWFAGVQWQRISAMVALVALGVVTYGVAILLTKATSLSELKAGFRR